MESLRSFTAEWFQKFCRLPHFKGKSRIENLFEPLIPFPRHGVNFSDGFFMDLNHNSPYERGVYFRSPELDTYQYFRNELSEGQVFFDCGANLGFYSFLASTLVGESGQVCAFEAFPPTYERLHSGIQKNKFLNIKSFQLALSGEEGTVEIYGSAGDNIGLSSVNKTGMSAGQSYKIKASTLDSLFFSGEVRPPHVIKLDIEGSELACLKGARETIQRFRPKLVVELSRATMNRFGYEPEEVVSFLLSLQSYEVEWRHAGRIIKVDPSKPLPHYAVLGAHHGANYFFT